MSDSNRVNLSYVQEVTFGTHPGTQQQNIRYTSESLHQETGTTSSQEIRSDRQVSDVIRTNVSAAGDVNVELSYDSFEDWWEALLQADTGFTGSNATVEAASALIAVQNTSEYFLSSGSWDNTPAVGDWIEVRGFTDASNNGYKKVTAATTTLITVEQTLVDEAEGDSITIVEGDSIVNGTTQVSYAFEKEYTDLTNIFEVLLGMTLSSGTVTIESDAIITGGFGFIGKSAASGTSTAGTGSNAAATTTSVMNAIDDVEAIFENSGTPYSVTSGSFTLNNNLRARQQVGTLGAISIGAGTIDLTGTVQAYFETVAVMDRYLNFTTSSLAIVCEDGAGNCMIFDFPSVKYTSGQRVSGGINQDVIADMAFTAYRDATELVTIRISKFDA